jgi:hypothetical protein
MLFYSKMKNPIVIDTRGILNSKTVSQAGIIYRGIGHV